MSGAIAATRCQRLSPMMRSTAARELVSELERAGLRAGRIDLPDIWPAVRSWLQVPVADVAPEDDERVFYLSFAPGDAGPYDTVFAGRHPTALAGMDLICIEIWREFTKQIDATTRRRLGAAGVTLWYAAGPAWVPLGETEGWIDMGPSTPHIDWWSDGTRVAAFTEELENSPAFGIACGERALVVTAGDGATVVSVVARS